MELLPEEISRECLICMPYEDFPAVRSVCKSWTAQIDRPEFRRDRKLAGRSQNVVVMAQVRGDRDSAFPVTSPAHQLTVFEPETGKWRDMPSIPGMSGRLPVFCGLVAVGSDLVVIGGWDPDTWQVTRSVHVYSFLSGKWRRGPDMPGGARSLFGASSDSDRTAYVAGGHDGDKNALKSALAYDVAGDTWATLPDMSFERDECKVAFHRGRIHVIGGYGNEAQGKFGRSAEALDAATWRWGPVEEDFLAADDCPRNSVPGADGALYTCHKSDLVVSRAGEWEVLARLPDDVSSSAFLMTWQGGLLAMSESGGVHVAYVLDLKKLTWTKLETPEKYRGHVLSGCCLEI